MESIVTFLIARFNSDGSLDEEFGSHGIVKTGFSGFAVSVYASAQFAALQPDGKILVTGSVMFAQQFSNQFEIALVRYTSDGSIRHQLWYKRAHGKCFEGNLPSGLLLRDDGNIYVGSGDNILHVSANGTIETVINEPNSGGWRSIPRKVITAVQESDSTGYHIAISRFLPNGRAGSFIWYRRKDYNQAIGV